MSTHKHIDKICCIAMVLALLLTVFFVNAGKLGVQSVMAEAGYALKLFDTSKVHTIDIVMDDWEGFLDTCENEEYTACAVVIDNEAYKNVGIRAKGNTSLRSVASYGNDRYSFKLEFDCYESGKTYHGLDKISLNNIIQDNTYIKDYLTYQMMRDAGVAAPLCSYVYITVNGEEWGLYLAVEGVEESFLARNYGNDYGELYKPDSMDMGGGRGNGGKFDMEKQRELLEEEIGFPEGMERRADLPIPENQQDSEGDFGDRDRDREFLEDREFPQDREFQERSEGGFAPKRDSGEGQMPQMPENAPLEERGPEGGNRGGMGMGLGSEDVALIYSDDSYDSYQNIFDNAKTEISDTDKDRLITSLKKLSQGEEIESVVDVDAVIKYFVVHNFVCNFDSYTGSLIHNYYLYEKDGKLSMIPWDYNLAFGGFQNHADAESMVNYPIDSPVSGDSIESRPMIAWIFNEEEYMEMYHQYFAEWIDSYFTSGRFEEMIGEVKELIAPYVEKDPTKFCSYEEFEAGCDALKEFCLLRAESVSGQLTGVIPATSQGQAEDRDSLVDAFGLSLEAMGTMEHGGMGGGR
ncbi:CotH kinase family protein [Parablautia muri]|uniref:Spore coat protein CotH n=1 Tax=Parablautia muri TaxID=2320879 RepID=A0A9X5BEA4_9FIRM|nr:CotH kinase family protein [Parablautia muri]NBJ92464.1 spore coat protein CotH [Parablautia muri]